MTYGEMSNRCTSSPRASAISLPPTLAMAWRARQLSTSLFESKSFRIELTTNRRKSEFSCINSVTARYPYIHFRKAKHNSWVRWRSNVRSASHYTLSSKSDWQPPCVRCRLYNREYKWRWFWRHICQWFSLWTETRSQGTNFFFWYPSKLPS